MGRMTKDYRLAPSGIGPLASQWKDKPHRLIYDLCREVDRLQDLLDGRLPLPETGSYVVAKRFGSDNEKYYRVEWQGECEATRHDGHQFDSRCLLAVDESGRDIALVEVEDEWVDAMSVATRAWMDAKCDPPAQELASRIDAAILG